MAVGVLFFTSVNVSCGKVIRCKDVAASDGECSDLGARVEALEAELAAMSMPHSPEIFTTDGRLDPLVVSTSNNDGGSVRYDGGGRAWLAGRRVELESFDSGRLDVNATYHLRVSQDGRGWAWAALRVPYRVPNAAAMDMPMAESDPGYDSTAQSMLVARIVTGNVNTPATVTMLANKQVLAVDGIGVGGDCMIANELRTASTRLDLNWARTPRGIASVFGRSLDDTWLQGYNNRITLSRYTAMIVSQYHTQNGGCVANNEEIQHRYFLAAL